MDKNIKLSFFKKIKQLQLYEAIGIDLETKKSMDYIIYAVMVGMISNIITTGAVWTGFLRDVVKANSFQLGIIAAVPVAVNTFQIPISYLIEKKKNRRFLFLFFGILGRSLWIVIGLVPFIIPELAAAIRIWVVIALVAFIASGNSFVNLAFQSLISDLVPINIRGRYFSARQRMSLLVGILAGLFVSWFMDLTGMIGYTILLILAGLTGVIDLFFFTRFSWPDMQLSPESATDSSNFFFMIKSVFKDQQYLLLMLFFVSWHFSVNLAAPFFNVYMLEYLNMSYTKITLYNQIVSNLITVFFVARWGRLLDQFGNKPIMQIAGIFCALIPFIWVFISPSLTWFVILQAVINGFFWPSMDLGQQNLSLNLSGESNRTMYVAIFSAIINLFGVALGNIVGGYLVQKPFLALENLKFTILGQEMTKFKYIFIVSGTFRLLTIFFILPLLKEKTASNLSNLKYELKKRKNLRKSTSKSLRQEE